MRGDSELGGRTGDGVGHHREPQEEKDEGAGHGGGAAGRGGQEHGSA